MLIDPQLLCEDCCETKRANEWTESVMLGGFGKQKDRKIGGISKLAI